MQIDFVLNRLQFKEPIGKTIHTSEQLRTIDRPSDQGWVSDLKPVELQQSKQFIWEQLDCKQLIRQLTK